MQARAAGAGSARASARVEQLERRQAAGEREPLAGGELERGGDAPRARRACSKEGLDARVARRLAARLARGPKPPLPASFTFTASQAPSSTARAHVVGRRRSARRRRSATTTRARTSASSSSVAHGCSTARGRAARARGSRSTASSTVQAPLASRRSAGHGPDRLAHRGHALRVVGQPDLELEAGVAVAQARLRAPRGHLLGRPGGQRQVHRDRVRARLAERPAVAARLQVEPRHLLGGPGLRRRAAPAAAAQRAPRARRAARRRRARTARPRRSPVTPSSSSSRSSTQLARGTTPPAVTNGSRNGIDRRSSERFTRAGCRPRAAARRRPAGGRCRRAPR